MRKLNKPKQTQINAWLIKLERYQGPFIRKGRNAINAVVEQCSDLGVYYLYNKFEVSEIQCRPTCLSK